MIQPRSKRVNDLILTPIILKLECSAVVRGLGRFHWSVVVMFRRVIPMTPPYFASVLIHLLNMYDVTDNVIVQLINMSFVYI